MILSLARQHAFRLSKRLDTITCLCAFFAPGHGNRSGGQFRPGCLLHLRLSNAQVDDAELNQQQLAAVARASSAKLTLVRCAVTGLQALPGFLVVAARGALALERFHVLFPVVGLPGGLQKTAEGPQVNGTQQTLECLAREQSGRALSRMFRVLCLSEGPSVIPS